MADKNERDWSEIFEEARQKASSDIKDIIDDIKPKIKEFVEKAREANFHDMAEKLLKEIEGVTSELKKSPAASMTNDKTKEKKPMYREEDGTVWYRKGKWSEKYTKAELDKLKIR